MNIKGFFKNKEQGGRMSSLVSGSIWTLFIINVWSFRPCLFHQASGSSTKVLLFGPLNKTRNLILE